MLAWRADVVHGTLFDTHWGFPAITLPRRGPSERSTDDGAGPVPGIVVDLDPTTLSRALPELDRYEGLAHDQYRGAR